MKNLILIIFSLSIFIVSCGEKKTCYKCNITTGAEGPFTPIGCFTDDEWAEFDLVNITGNSIDKNTRCVKTTDK